jgi:hypothetical protein
VTSAAKWRANRRNAQKCTGPRTALGKARSARNARRHGLTQSAQLDPKLAQVIATLAQAIAGEGADRRRRERAAEIALAQVEVMRVREARRDLCARALDARTLNGGDVIKRMANLARYERRALAQRKRAIRRLGPRRERANADVSNIFDKTKPKICNESKAPASPATRRPAASRHRGRPSFTKRNQKFVLIQQRARRVRWRRRARPPPMWRRPRVRKLVRRDQCSVLSETGNSTAGKSAA